MDGIKTYYLKLATLRYEGCACSLSKSEGWVFLWGLITLPEYRERKSATRLLRIVKKWARRKKLSVYLDVGPFADEPMNHESLCKFYKKMGFVEENFNRMIYIPKGKYNGKETFN